MMRNTTECIGYPPSTPQAQFNHVGTTGEYLQHLCYNSILAQSLQFATETAVQSLTTPSSLATVATNKQQWIQRVAGLLMQLNY